MKKILLLPLLLTMVLMTSFNGLQGQCTPDPQYTSPGIYPSDTLPDMTEGVSVNTVVHFVFPNDTVFQGFQVNFDSFTVNSLSNIPPNLQWQCDNNHPVCSYVVISNQVTRGCVTISDIPQAQSAAYPGYDSVIVNGSGWITFFGSPNPIPVDIPVYYRVASATTDLDQGFANQLGLEVNPNPVSSATRVSYDLPFSGDVSIGVYNAYGQKVMDVAHGFQTSGYHSLSLDLGSRISEGIYFLRFDMNDGEYQATRKLISLN